MSVKIHGAECLLPYILSTTWTIKLFWSLLGVGFKQASHIWIANDEAY